LILARQGTIVVKILYLFSQTIASSNIFATTRTIRWKDSFLAFQDIAKSLEEKHRLLAEYSGIEESQLDALLDMSSHDPEAELRTVVMHSLSCGEYRASRAGVSNSNCFEGQIEDL